MSDTAITLDLQEKYTRLGDTLITPTSVELTALGVKETAPFFMSTDNQQSIDKQAEVIAQLYSSLKLKKKIVNVVVPDSATYSQIVSMPMLKEKELLSAIRYQSDEFIPMPIDETNLDIEILREDQATKKLLVLIVAAPKKLVAQIEKTIEAAGLIPGNLENELTAAGRFFSERLNKVKKPNASVVVNFGSSSTSLYLIDGQTSLMLFTRSFKIGLDLFLKDIKINLNIDEVKTAEALKTIGFAGNGSYNLDAILAPLMKELFGEIERFIAVARERHNVTVDSVYTYNYDNQVLLFDKKIEASIKIPTVSVPVQSILKQNPVSQSFSTTISSFLSIVGGSL